MRRARRAPAWAAAAALAAACAGPARDAAAPSAPAPSIGGAAKPAAQPAPALPEVDGPLTLVVQDGHGHGIRALAYSPDGAALVSGDQDGEVRLWDVRTGALRGLLGRLHADVHALAFRQDGARVAAAARSGGAVLVWDPHTGARAGAHSPPGSTGGHVALFFAAERLLVASSSSRDMHLWSADPPGPTRDIAGPESAQSLMSAAATPDGRLLALTHHAHAAISLHDAATGAPVASVPTPRGLWPELAFSPTGKLLARGDYKEPVVVWDVAARKVVATLAGGEPSFHAIAWGPDDRFIAYARTGAVFVRALPGGEELARIQVPGDAHALAVSPGGETLAVGGWDPWIHVFGARGGAPAGMYGGAGRIARFLWSPQGHAFVLGSSSGPSRFCRMTADRPACSRLEGTRSAVRGLAMPPDASRIAVRQGGEVAVHEAATGRRVGKLSLQGCHERGNVALSPDAKRVVAACHDGRVRFLDIDGGQERIWETDRHHQVAFSPDGARLALGHQGGTVSLWDAGTSRRVKDLTSSRAEGDTVIAWSPDGARLAAGFSGGILVWGVSSGAVEKSVLLRGQTVTALAFAPDGATLASGAEDGAVTLWDAAQGKKQRDLPGVAPLPVRALSFDPRGAFLAASGAGARLYRLADDASLRLEAVADGDRDGILAYTDEGLVDGDEVALSLVRYRGAGDWVAAPLFPIERVASRFLRPGMLARFLSGGPVAGP